MKGEKVPGYKQEKGVNPGSATETFAAVKFYIDNWRWQDVPFYVRTGKRMNQKASNITIQFKAAPTTALCTTTFKATLPHSITRKCSTTALRSGRWQIQDRI